MQNDGSLLRAARERLGWSQSRAANELADLASRRGHHVASPASLKTQLSRWENQHVLPEDTYRVLLGELYDRTDAELGLVTPQVAAPADEADQLRSALAVAEGVDIAGLELLEAQLAATEALDRKLGSAAVADSLDAQLSHLERVLTHTLTATTRRRLAGLVGSAAVLAGRVEADKAHPATAWRHFERAKQAAREAGDELLSCWALVEQATVLVDIGRPAEAIEALDIAGEHQPPDAGPLFTAWLCAHLGTAHAAAGAAQQARRAYRTAEDELGGASVPASLQVDTGRPAGIQVEFDRAAFHRQRGQGWHALRRDVDAIADLESALSGGGSARDVAAIHVDLAHAFSATGDLTSAATHARTARELATRIGSTLLSTRLDAGGQPGAGGQRPVPVSRS